MKTLKNKIKRIFMPLAIMLMVAVFAIFTPIASVAGAVRISATTQASSATISISNLPARYVELNSPVNNPTVSGSGSYELWHAGRIINSSSYNEAGKYTWKFYDGSRNLFDTYTVYVAQSEYQIIMPTTVTTVAPKSIGKLTMPLPEKITKDGEEVKIEDYAIEVNASMGSTNLIWGTDIKLVNNQIEITLEKFGSQVGAMKVTYLLKDKNSNLIYAAKVLTDVEIKDVKVADVTFAKNPTAPSVSSLTYKDEVELTKPTVENAKYDGKTFSVESWTEVVAVKYAEEQPDNWDKVSTVSITDGNYVVIDGLKVSTQKLGWYKFKFKTTTLFGNKTENKDDEDGQYWSDAVHIKQDSTIPKMKFVAPFTADDVNDLLNNFDDISGDDDYSKYLPMTSEPQSGAKKITINSATGVKLPAIIAKDNGTAYNDLRYTVTVAQMKDASGNNITNSSNKKTVSNYDPKKMLSVNFNSNPTVNANNEIEMQDVNGLYQVTFQAYEKQPLYPNGDAGSGYDRPGTKVVYFSVDNTFDVSVASNSPTINSFLVSDVYLWEGSKFDFTVPTAEDKNTVSTGIQMDYYLVNATQVAKLDSSKISDGKITVDLNNLVDESGVTIPSFDTNEVYIYAVARNFNALQTELRNGKFQFPIGTSGVLGKYPADGSTKDGATFKLASFKIFKSLSAGEAATVSSVTLDVTDNGLKSGSKIEIDSLTTEWSKNSVDGKVSVSVFLVKDGKRTPVQIYNSNDEVVSTVLFNKYNSKNNVIKDWYFIPGVGGEYQMVVTSKENASNISTNTIYNFTVAKNGEWEGGLVPSSISPMADTSNTSITVGQTATLPGWKGKAEDGTDLVAKNRLLFKANDLNSPVGDYTITVKGVNDTNCLVGNKFTPNFAGTYKFEYNMYYGSGSVYSTIYVVTVTEGSSENSTIKMNEAYGNYADNKITSDASDPADAPKYAITLQEFMLSNKGGTNNFILGKNFLQSNLEDNGDSTYSYPAIAIPMPNITSGIFTAEDVEITVQKSGSTDYLVSSKKMNIDGKASKIGTVDGYFTFRPDGKFTSNGDDYMTSAVDKNEASAVYVVTYKLPNGKTSVYNVTVGNPEVGELVFDMSNGFLTYKNGNKTVNIDSENNKPIIDKNSDGKRIVTINIKNVTYNGKNENFMELIEKGAGDTSGITDKVKLAQMYMWENALVTISHNGSAIIYPSTWKPEEKNAENMTYTFELSEGSGTYKVEIRLPNPFMNSSSAVQTFEFTLDANATNKNLNLSTVWGIILIVLSIGLLAGVIFYFIKTSRETKFMDTPKMPKKSKKQDANKITDAQKDTEVQKETEGQK